jgi:hypothetical protein
MRYLTAMCVAGVLLFLAFWVGARIAAMVSQPNRLPDDFTVGQKMDLCGYQVDIRHRAAGYDLDVWSGPRCDSLSKLDECVLECLSEAGTVEIATACYSDCVAR